MHPLLVHLPIGFIIFLAVIEVAACWTRFKEAMTVRRLLLLVSVISVVLTAICGWILSLSGGYSEKTLAWHKWLGTALVPATILLQVLVRCGALSAYRVCLGLTLILLLCVGDYGNTLVRGEGYLFPKSRSSKAKGEMGSAANDPGHSISGSSAYASLVQPIFNEYCVRCHGPEKSKGKLRLDTSEHLFKGAESGPVVQPGSAAQSELVKRLRLPLDNDDHMPPDGKKQPDAQKIAVLEWWINVGAPVDKTINDLKLPESR